jgi:hypothetical protein
MRSLRIIGAALIVVSLCALPLASQAGAAASISVSSCPLVSIWDQDTTGFNGAYVAPQLQSAYGLIAIYPSPGFNEQFYDCYNSSTGLWSFKSQETGAPNGGWVGVDGEGDLSATFSGTADPSTQFALHCYGSYVNLQLPKLRGTPWVYTTTGFQSKPNLLGTILNAPQSDSSNFQIGNSSFNEC